MRKQFVIRRSVPVEQIGDYMGNWSKRAPGFVAVSTVGVSGIYPIFCAKLTDPDVPDEDKEVAIITAQHTGMEISGMNAVFGVGNRLCSLDQEARTILRHLIVLLVPCPNPFTYAKQDPEWQFRNAAGVCEYAHAFSPDGVIDPVKTPAADAIRRLIDFWKPEAFFDSHGVWYENAIMLESLGNLSFSGTNRMHSHRIAQDVVSYIEQQDYPAYSEDDAQTLPYSGRISTEPRHKRHFQFGSESAVAQSYAYTQYHTLVGSAEVSWELSGTLRMMRCLRAGCQIWDDSDTPGYPVRTIILPIGLNALRINGTNAAQRRSSRVELWQNSHSITTGLMHPEMPGLSCVIAGTSSATCRRILGPGSRLPMDELMNRLDQEGIDTKLMRILLDDHWDGVYASVDLSGEESFAPEHGMTIRIGLPYPNAVPHDVLLNGALLCGADADQWSVIRHRSKVDVDIRIPKTQSEFSIVMVRYSHDHDCRDNAIPF